jgi:thiazole biosynthesis enzyme
MHIDETRVSRQILTGYFEKLNSILDLDVAVVGGGPSGLVAAAILSEQGHRVAVFERHLSPGGGTWGGGMMFNEVVLEDESLPLLDKFGIRHRPAADSPGHLADSVELAAALIVGALHRGVRIMNCITVQDVMVKEDRMCGLVINWSPVDAGRWHVDPLLVGATWTIDATGHESSVVQKLQTHGLPLKTPTGRILGEGPMWVGPAEEMVVRNTGEIFPGLFVTGMAANAVMGGYRMGPVFGGMLLSGQKAAALIHDRLTKS